jgi:hypothetical protein
MASGAMRREYVPVTDDEQSVLELLRQDTRERRALTELVGELGTSRAAVAHAVLSVGVDAVRARVQELAYVELAESFPAHEDAERRAEAASRRARAADRWDRE